MPCLRRLCRILILAPLAMTVQAEDLHVKKNITVDGNVLASSEVWAKGARERTLNTSSAGNTVILRQCDLNRTITLNQQTRTYFVADDPQDAAAVKAATLITGTPAAPVESSGTITQNSVVTDTGELKQILGYRARHLKTRVSVLAELVFAN